MDKVSEKQLIISYNAWFNDPHGKIVMEDLKKLSRVCFSTLPCDNTGKLDSHMMSYQNGQKSVLIHIYAMLKKDPNVEKQTRAINVKGKEDG